MPQFVSASLSPSIIIVDDDAALISALEFFFDLEGFAVQTFASAEALLACEALPDRACLVVDYRLPGANGLELLSALRARGVDRPALLTTTHPSAEVRRQAQALGVRIIEKPLLGDALGAAVREALAPPSGETAPWSPPL